MDSSNHTIYSIEERAKQQYHLESLVLQIPISHCKVTLKYTAIMPRYKLTIEYDGTPFCGWQKQADDLSVQTVLEHACMQFMAADAPIEVTCSGRTDAGVHAWGQVAHVDFAEARPIFNIIQGLNNYMLPHPVSVVAAEEVAADFNARFDARMRHYRYRIINRKARIAIDALRAWQVPNALNEAAMQTAANHLLGHHDFSSFRSSHCQAKSAMRTVSAISVTRQHEEITIDCSARSFLHHQVRNMVGTLVQVGLGNWQPEKVKAVLEARDRREAGANAPAHGLYFMRVEYD
jgi:tRNA pseudouridine38-40 synthase